MELEIGLGSDWPWNKLRHGRLWRLLRRVKFLRTALYLAMEVQRMLRESQTCSREVWDQVFETHTDPWKSETSPVQRERFIKQTEMLDAARDGSTFCRGLEIGCSEGLYTEVLADRCESLLVLEISRTVLARTQKRRRWSEQVRFDAFDFRLDDVPGTFDLIVVAGVLEYFSRPNTFVRMRAKLAAALRPDGYLLLETTRANPLLENSWWGRRLIRGRWINVFVAEHPSLVTVSSFMTDSYSIILCRKLGSASARSA
jgi:SAM-dependent methyltransferase